MSDKYKVMYRPPGERAFKTISKGNTRLEAEKIVIGRGQTHPGAEFRVRPDVPRKGKERRLARANDDERGKKLIERAEAAGRTAKEEGGPARIAFTNNSDWFLRYLKRHGMAGKNGNENFSFSTYFRRYIRWVRSESYAIAFVRECQEENVAITWSRAQTANDQTL